MQHDRQIICDEQIFRVPDQRMLSDALHSLEEARDGTALRDARSAFRFLSERCGVDLGATVATPKVVRALFAGLSPARLGVSEKRLANIRSIVTRAVEEFGQPRTWLTRGFDMAPDWEALLGKVQKPENRWGLHRLAVYCSKKGISPDAVTSDTLIGLRAAVDAEGAHKNPKVVIKITINRWNRCVGTVPGWPAHTLSTPNPRTPYMFPLTSFPQSFQDDVAHWEERMRHPDILDPRAPVRAFRPDTLEGYRYTFRRLASALVRDGQMSHCEIVDLSVFFEETRLKTALRPFLQGTNGIQTEGYAYKMTTQLLTVGRSHLGLDERALEPVRRIAARLKPKTGPAMGARNRRLLEQFDDDDVVQRLLRFPADECARAMRLQNLTRRAKGVERALAISLAIFTGLRVKNLRQLHLTRNLRRSGTRVFIRIDETEAKTHASLELELPRETIDLLDLFLAEHRHRLDGADGPYLFPGQTGGARSYDAMRHALTDPLWRHAGIRMSPHLYRHVIAKIIVERYPHLTLDVSRRLGHKSLNTTYESYLGTEGPAASRRVNEILEGIREDQT